MTFIGLLYGITAAATFAFFIGLEIVAILADLTADFQLDEMDIGQIVYPGRTTSPSSSTCCSRSSSLTPRSPRR